MWQAAIDWPGFWGAVSTYQTLIGALAQAAATITALIAAALTVNGQLKSVEVQIHAQRAATSKQEIEERQAAALLIWSEIRTIERGCREWIQKWSRRNTTLQAFTSGDTGTPINVPMSTDLYKSQTLRLARFSPQVLEQIVFFYEAAPVYMRILGRPVRPPDFSDMRDVHRELFCAIELEVRANKLAALVYAEYAETAGVTEAQPDFEPPLELSQYTPLFDTIDGYLDFGDKEERARTCADQLRKIILEKRSVDVPRGIGTN